MRLNHPHVVIAGLDPALQDDRDCVSAANSRQREAGAASMIAGSGPAMTPGW